MKEIYEDYYRQLGFNIAKYRKLRKMTQMQLAEAVDLSRTHISNIEAAHMTTRVSIEALFDIANVLEIPVKELFDFEEIEKK
ncbi:MAG: helix-turn-helix domain-containing protein [Lachnospiraceae bacterium]